MNPLKAFFGKRGNEKGQLIHSFTKSTVNNGRNFIVGGQKHDFSTNFKLPMIIDSIEGGRKKRFVPMAVMSVVAIGITLIMKSIYDNYELNSKSADERVKMIKDLLKSDASPVRKAVLVEKLLKTNDKMNMVWTLAADSEYQTLLAGLLISHEDKDGLQDVLKRIEDKLFQECTAEFLPFAKELYLAYGEKAKDQEERKTEQTYQKMFEWLHVLYKGDDSKDASNDKFETYHTAIDASLAKGNLFDVLNSSSDDGYGSGLKTITLYMLLRTDKGRECLKTYINGDLFKDDYSFNVRVLNITRHLNSALEIYCTPEALVDFFTPQRRLQLFETAILNSGTYDGKRVFNLLAALQVDTSQIVNVVDEKFIPFQEILKKSFLDKETAQKLHLVLTSAPDQLSHVIENFFIEREINHLVAACLKLEPSTQLAGLDTLIRMVATGASGDVAYRVMQSLPQDLEQRLLEKYVKIVRNTLKKVGVPPLYNGFDTESTQQNWKQFANEKTAYHDYRTACKVIDAFDWQKYEKRDLLDIMWREMKDSPEELVLFTRGKHIHYALEVVEMLDVQRLVQVLNSENRKGLYRIFYIHRTNLSPKEKEAMGKICKAIHQSENKKKIVEELPIYMCMGGSTSENFEERIKKAQKFLELYLEQNK